MQPVPSPPPPDAGRCAGLRHAVPIFIHIEARDTGKRLSSLLILVLVTAVAGFGKEAVIFFACAMSYEVSRLWFTRTTPSDPKEITALRAVTILTVLVCANGIYFAPGLLLASHTSIAIVVLAMMWIFGMVMHMSNTYAAVGVEAVEREFLRPPDDLDPVERSRHRGHRPPPAEGTVAAPRAGQALGDQVDPQFDRAAVAGGLEAHRPRLTTGIELRA